MADDHNLIIKQISIHAPHARSDAHAAMITIRRANFNPRSSCEERPKAGAQPLFVNVFQSTLLMRGAT